jgi:hypothetical protein
MREHPDIIRGNIKRYEKLLKVDSPSYTHENVRSLLAESRARLASEMGYGSTIPLLITPRRNSFAIPPAERPS